MNSLVPLRRCLFRMMLLHAALLTVSKGAMYDVVNAVSSFVAPPECPLGCMNWTAALNAAERAANFVDPSIVPSLGASCVIPGRAIHSLTRAYLFATLPPAASADPRRGTERSQLKRAAALPRVLVCYSVSPSHCATFFHRAGRP